MSSGSGHGFLNRLFVSRGYGADDSDPEAGDPQRILQRKERTKRAREASLVSRALKKAQKDQASASQEFTAAQTLQRQFFTGRLHHAFAMLKPYDVIAPDPKKSIQKDRARCAWSLLCSLAKALETVFSVEAPVKHLINTIVPDDTTTRLRGPSQGDRTMVFTIMNQVQSCIVSYEHQIPHLNVDWHCISIPCPTAVLKMADTPNIHAAYTIFLLASAEGVGKGLQRLGVSPELPGIRGAKWIVQIMCGDALEANSAAFHLERRLLAQTRDAHAQFGKKVALRCKCGNHQLCLTRKCIVLGIERYWATLVRLAHLFECSSFRRRFTAQLLSFLQTPGVFQRHLSHWQCYSVTCFIFSLMFNFPCPCI